MPRAERLSIASALGLLLLSALVFLSPPPPQPALPPQAQESLPRPRPEPSSGWAESLASLFPRLPHAPSAHDRRNIGQGDSSARILPYPPLSPGAGLGREASQGKSPPGLSWLGMVGSPSGAITCLFRDEASLSCFNLEEGASEGGWRLLKMGEESCLLERDGQEITAWRKR